MASGWLVSLVAAAYLGLLFAVARYGELRAMAGRSLLNGNVYALSLAVYCTAWTFFGSVGRAASGGLSFLTIYLGPTLMLLFVGVAAKMIRVSKEQHLTSIADFIAARYGKSRLLAGLVTVIAVVGVVPYIALQLKAVAVAFDLFVQRPGHPPWWADSTLGVALLLALFSILFGTRRLDASERHEGLVVAVAFESLVKLVAFVAVGAVVTYGLFAGWGDLFQRAAALPEAARLLGRSTANGSTWTALVVVSGLAILCLPRQFQMMVVENVDAAHLRRALWLFPLYLLAINLFVLPVALGGLIHFQGQGGNPDAFVLTLPLAQGAWPLALLVFVGGLAAATGMVIVETIALATMVCNDLAMPGLLRLARYRAGGAGDLPRTLLVIRRLAIVGVVGLGYLYYRMAGEAYALVGIGLISFTAVAQFAPAMIGGLYWRQGGRRGAVAGLLGGFAVWAYTLLLPSFARSGWMDDGFVVSGPWGLAVLKAQALFGLAGLDEVAHALFWSLLVNIGLYVGLSLGHRPDRTEAEQARRFVDGGGAGRSWRGQAGVGELTGLLARFLGASRVAAWLAEVDQARGGAAWRQQPADADFVRLAEDRLAGAIGSASARVMVASVVREETVGLDEVLDILDEASQVRAYSRELEDKSRQLEAATAELRAANRRLLEVDRLKDDFIATVTHELRTPLTSIRALSEMLYDDPDIAVADRSRFLGIVLAEAERLSRLINQMLDLARLESGRAEWTTGAVEVGEVVARAVEAMGQMFRDRGVALSCQVAPGLPPVMADRDRLMQVVVNLLSNAVKFVPGGSGKVGVRVGADNELQAIRVEVADNGPGLSEDELESVFEKFRQGGNTLTAKPQGTGLGLPISRQIVEYFGGRLWAESTPGAGARFCFTIPLPNKDNEGDKNP